MASILIAEDDAAERGLMARSLSADGHKVVEAENGQVALQCLLANPSAFDILVTDVEMPELDGIELARRAMAAKSGLLVLLISGFAGSMDRAADIFAHGARSLIKPIQLEKIRSEIRSMLG